MDELTEHVAREIEQIYSSWIEFEVAAQDHSLKLLCADDIELWPPDAQPLLGRAAVSTRLAHGTTRIHNLTRFTTPVQRNMMVRHMAEKDRLQPAGSSTLNACKTAFRKQNPEMFFASQKSPANLVLGVLFTAILSLAHSGTGQADKPGGRISGHVYRADTHTPLAEVTMILQVASGAAAPFQTVETAADGSYSFDNLDAKDYTLAAWKTGFVAQFFGVDAPGGQHLEIAPGLLLEGIDFSLRLEAQIVQMADAPLSEVYPYLRRTLTFYSGSFSPDGSEFAVGLGNIRSGDLDEVWLYSLREGRLRRVTDRPGPYLWGRDGKLYAWFWSNRKRYVVATPDSISEIDQPPSDVAAAFARWSPSGLPDTRHAGEYVVSAEPEGHGSFRLLVRSPGKPQAYVIAEGSWELETFLLNPARRQVLYPKPGWSLGSIVNYNLRTGQSASLNFQSGENLRLLDLTGDGRLLAFSVTGRCGQSPSSYQWLLSIASGLERATSNVCFVRPQ